MYVCRIPSKDKALIMKGYRKSRLYALKVKGMKLKADRAG